MGIKGWKIVNIKAVIKRKATRYHECDDCNCDIKIGEEYYVITYRGDDWNWHTVRICERCWVGRELDFKGKVNYIEI